MNRYIDPQKIHYFKLANGEKVATKESIDKIPAANVREVKHGHWIKNVKKVMHGHWIKTKYVWTVCSNCLSTPRMYFPFNYCPYCGAEMDGEEEHQFMSFDEEEDDAEVVH